MFIQVRLIKGIYNTPHKYNMLEQLLLSKMSPNSCVDIIQEQELIKKFYSTENQEEIADTYMIKKTKLKCKYCNCKHEIKREDCPAFR